MTVKDEAEGAQTVTIEWRNEKFTLPASLDDLPIDALLAMENGKVANACQALLSRADFARMKSLGGTRNDLADFMDVVADVYGFGDAGK